MILQYVVILYETIFQGIMEALDMGMAESNPYSSCESTAIKDT